jgi:hypothetical protein
VTAGLVRNAVDSVVEHRRRAPVTASCAPLQKKARKLHAHERSIRIRARDLPINVPGAVDECAEHILHDHAFVVPNVAGVRLAFTFHEREERGARTVQVRQLVTVPWVEDFHGSFLASQRPLIAPRLSVSAIARA